MPGLFIPPQRALLLGAAVLTLAGTGVGAYLGPGSLGSPSSAPCSAGLGLQLAVALFWVAVHPASARNSGAQLMWCTLIVGLWSTLHPRSFGLDGSTSWPSSWLWLLALAGGLWGWNRMWARPPKPSAGSLTSPLTNPLTNPGPKTGSEAANPAPVEGLGQLLVLCFWLTYGILGGWLLTLGLPANPTGGSGVESQAALVGMSATIVVHVSRRLHR